jgi:hypothetical protein
MVPLATQALPAALLFIGMALSNESPRWLAKRDRWEDARSILSRIRHLSPDHPYVQEEIREMFEQLEDERQLIQGSSFIDLLREMFTIPSNRKRVLISIGLMIGQQMTGVNAINYYAPQIFINLGLTGNESSLFATGIYGLVKMTTCALFLLLVADSLGRRKSLLWTSIAQGVSMFYIGFYVRFDPPKPHQAVPPVGYVAIVMIFLFASFFQFGWGPVCWIYVYAITSVSDLLRACKAY